MIKNKLKINNPFSKSNIVIFIPLILVMFLDLIFTTIGQPEYYWQDHNFFNELNPIGQMLLSAGPIYWILISILYIALVLFLIANLPRPFNIMMAITFFLGHAWGSASWVTEIFYKFFLIEIGYWYANIIYFIVIAIISGFCISGRFKEIRNNNI